jgi:hypothetical protein
MECGARTPHNHGAVVAQEIGAYADDEPAEVDEFGMPNDVVVTPRRIRPMLLAVVLDTYAELLPAHVDASKGVAGLVD